MHEPQFRRRASSGFSLVELLVAAAITLLGLLVVAQVFAVYEGWKRTTTGVAQTQEGGLLGAFAIEQDLRNAGLGMAGLRCATINAYNSHLPAPHTFELPGMPVTITQNSPAAGSDEIRVMYGSSPFGNVVATLQSAMPLSSSALNVDNGFGFNRFDLMVISQPAQPCSIVQRSDDGQVIGPANVTSPGSSWALQHFTSNSGSSLSWNPPLATNIFPLGGYAQGAKVLNLGNLVDHRYYVQDSVLRIDVREPANVGASFTSYDLIPGVIGLRARYGRDTDDDGAVDVFDNDTADLIAKSLASTSGNTLVAIQFSLIVRSGNWEKAEVSPAAIAYWPGGPELALDDDARHYRYRVFQTVVPLKNMLWNH